MNICKFKRCIFVNSGSCIQKIWAVKCNNDLLWIYISTFIFEGKFKCLLMNIWAAVVGDILQYILLWINKKDFEFTFWLYWAQHFATMIKIKFIGLCTFVKMNSLNWVHYIHLLIIENCSRSTRPWCLLSFYLKASALVALCAQNAQEQFQRHTLAIWFKAINSVYAI